MRKKKLNIPIKLLAQNYWPQFSNIQILIFALRSSLIV